MLYAFVQVKFFICNGMLWYSSLVKDLNTSSTADVLCHSTNMSDRYTSVPDIFMRRNRQCHEPVERKNDIEIEREANAGNLIKIYVDDAQAAAAAEPHRPTTCVSVCVCLGWAWLDCVRPED